MNNQIERIKKIRFFLIESINDLSVDQLNKIPLGFNNNIVWNLGHLIAAQQGVCYIRANLKPAVEETLIMQYKSGTRPETHIADNNVAIIKTLLLSSLELFDSDYQNNLFSNYVSWTTRYGVELLDINDAIDFLAYHEGLHSGTIMALKRLVKE